MGQLLLSMDQYSTVQTSPFKYFASSVNCIRCSTVEKEKKKKKERKKIRRTKERKKERNKCRLKGRGEKRKKEKARKKKVRKKEKKEGRGKKERKKERKEGVKERNIIMTIQLIKSHPSPSSFVFFSAGARSCIFLIQ